jgi:hypothetical protein
VQRDAEDGVGHGGSFATGGHATGRASAGRTRPQVIFAHG